MNDFEQCQSGGMQMILFSSDGCCITFIHCDLVQVNLMAYEIKLIVR